MNDPHILDSALGSSLLTGDSSKLLAGLQTQLIWLFWLGTGISIIVIIMFIVSIVHKMRVQAAILRMDKNLQKLVDAQILAVEKVGAPAPTAKNSANTDIEQK